MAGTIARQSLTKRRPVEVRRSRPSFIGLLLALLATWVCGCQTVRLPDKLPWPWANSDEKPGTVDHILAVWTEAVHSQSGKLAQRGFGGRLMFFDAQQKPIKVEGQVSIFVFDDQQGDIQDPAAKYKFIFPSDVLDCHFSQSDLGPSYSFWIPLAAANAPTQHFSLVAKFEGGNGETVLSSLTKKVMVGSGPALASVPSEPLQSPVQQVAYQEQITNPSSVARATDQSIRSETIELTPNFSRRLAQNPSTLTASEDQLSKNALSRTTDSAQPSSFADRSETAVSPEDSNVNRSAESVHSRPTKRPAPLERSSPPNAAAPRREPHRAGWLSGLPPTPRSGFQTERTTNDQSTSELSRRAEEWFRAQTENPTPEGAPTKRSDDAVGQAD